MRLPVLLFTCNYYLTDVETAGHGPTQTVPGSHLFGAPPPNPIEGSGYEDQVISNTGPAGSVIMFNNQVWHRGGPNQSSRTRYITQISYARRVIGHKFYPFMNYQMPQHVYAGAGGRLRRLLGFLPHGGLRIAALSAGLVRRGHLAGKGGPSGLAGGMRTSIQLFSNRGYCG